MVGGEEDHRGKERKREREICVEERDEKRRKRDNNVFTVHKPVLFLHHKYRGSESAGSVCSEKF
eukprot:65745-Amorphochlora_amoeboformis.AAC.1